MSTDQDYHKALQAAGAQDNLASRALFQAGFNAGRAAQQAPVSMSGPTPAEIYQAYPKKVGRQAAFRAIAAALNRREPGVNASYLLERTKAFAEAVKTWPAADLQFVPHCATWMNGGRYDDDAREWQRGPVAAPSQFGRS